mgnify:CR=1 FL=1
MTPEWNEWKGEINVKIENTAERFGLIDDDVPAGLEPDLRTERLVDFRLHAVVLEDRRLLRVELDAIVQLRREPIDEIDDPLILEFIVDPDRREIGRQLIAQDALNQIQVALPTQQHKLLIYWQVKFKQLLTLLHQAVMLKLRRN